MVLTYAVYYYMVQVRSDRRTVATTITEYIGQCRIFVIRVYIITCYSFINRQFSLISATSSFFMLVFTT